MKIYVIADYACMDYAGFCDYETYWTVFSITLLKAPDLHKSIVSLEERGSGQMVFTDLSWGQVKKLCSITGIELVYKAKFALSWGQPFNNNQRR